MSRIDMNSAVFPILKTERLTLRQLSIDDHQDILLYVPTRKLMSSLADKYVKQKKRQ
jgi:hypothetical protein